MAELKKSKEPKSGISHPANPQEQFALAVCYENGRGVAKDFKKALDLYAKAAEQGYAEAQYRLAFWYEYGEMNVKKAVGLYKLAAEQKNAEALYQLANCCEYGKGVRRNPEIALLLYILAAREKRATKEGQEYVQYLLNTWPYPSDKQAAEKLSSAELYESLAKIETQDEQQRFEEFLKKIDKAREKLEEKTEHVEEKASNRKEEWNSGAPLLGLGFYAPDDGDGKSPAPTAYSYSPRLFDASAARSNSSASSSSSSSSESSRSSSTSSSSSSISLSYSGASEE